MEPICAIKDIYKILYQFEKTFAEVHDITINEAMLLCCLKAVSYTHLTLPTTSRV